MGQVSFRVSSVTAAPPAVVFALLCDGASWPRWSPIGSFQLERPAYPPGGRRPGDDGPDTGANDGRDSDDGEGGGGEGVGAIRRFRTSFVTSREEVTAVEPDVRFAYRALSGLPISGHLAVVELTPSDGGTTITWSEEFSTRVPGLARFLRNFVQRCADGLASRAAADTGVGRPGG